MNIKRNDSRIVYPMSMLEELLTPDQVKSYSEPYHFWAEDKYFHFSDQAEFLESLTTEDIALYNDAVPPSRQLQMYTA